MTFRKPWEFNETQTITVRNRQYNVHEAIRLAADIPVREMDIADLNIQYPASCDNTLRSFVEHTIAVEQADTSYPVLMNENGYIIDGLHRLARLLVTGEKTIRFQRFESDPKSCYTEV